MGRLSSTTALHMGALLVVDAHKPRDGYTKLSQFFQVSTTGVSTITKKLRVTHYRTSLKSKINCVVADQEKLCLKVQARLKYAKGNLDKHYV